MKDSPSGREAKNSPVGEGSKGASHRGGGGVKNSPVREGNEG